ncbi:3-deoxy-7-phosphoheptulonate synthase [Pisolithus microcarpus]|nr:3-deoxy-7-phosphoheptulonate synthase [Pisolithus microcarpus]
MYNITPVPEDVKQIQQTRRVIGYDPLVSRITIASARYQAARILAGQDDRVLVAVEYAQLLRDKIPTWENLLIIMRAYFEKPRTTVGWKGLINDPDIGVPVGSELLDTISPQYISDLISWGAIGARTTESQLHRELASGISFPIGFQERYRWKVRGAYQRFRGRSPLTVSLVSLLQSMLCVPSSNPHAFMGVTEQGLAAIVKTRGNQDVHVILRGGSKGPNFASEHVRAAVKSYREGASLQIHPSIMIDCSRDRNITGVMVESHINAGRQDHGVSITDACVDWETTVTMLDRLNEAVGQRRTFLIEQGLQRPAGFQRSTPPSP